MAGIFQAMGLPTMNNTRFGTTIRHTASAVALLALSTAAQADFGIGVKAGTLGVGVEGRWEPLPWIDLRLGANRYDFEDDGTQAGIPYDATLALDNYYLTGNLRVPANPLRFTVGAFGNGNEIELRSRDDGGSFNVGGDTYTAAEIGTLTSVTRFNDIAPYIGVGFDFELFGKAGLNLDFGVLWQGDPDVTLESDGQAANLPAFQDSLESERRELESDMSDFKAWPVISLGFVYNF